MQQYDIIYFTSSLAVLNEQMRQISHFCSDAQRRIDEMEIVLEDIRTESNIPQVPDNWMTYKEPNSNCDCDVCRCAADYRMD